MASDVRCVCPCHTHSGTYPPPCNVCGHDTREGRWVGGYRGWWEPNNDPRDEQNARLTALLAERDADAFTANDLAILYRLVDEYTESAYADLARDHESHRVREALRDRVTRHRIAAREAERAALAARGGEGQG